MRIFGGNTGRGEIGEAAAGDECPGQSRSEPLNVAVTLTIRVWFEKAGCLWCESVDVHVHSTPVDSVVPSCFLGYEFAFEKLQQILIKTVHAFIEGGFDVAGEEMQIIARNGLLRAGVASQDLQTRDSFFEGAREETLAGDGVQTTGQQCARVSLFRGGMKLADAVNRLSDGVGVERGQNQMARFRRLHSRLNAVSIPDFADEDDLGVLPHGIPDAGYERFGVHRHLTLLELALFFFENIFNRILNRDDPQRRRFV